MCVTGMEPTRDNELHFAVETANFRSAEDLLTRGTTCIDECNTAGAGDTPLMLTLGRESSLRMAKLLLRFGANLNKVSTVHGHSALSICVEFGDMSKVAFLVSGGADINGRVRGGGTPLHVATRLGNTEVMKYLLLRGADPLIPTRVGGDTVALDVATQVEVVRTLFKYGKGLDGCGGLRRGRHTLGVAVLSGNLGVVRALSEEGVQDDGTALHFALQQPDCSIVEHLLRMWETNRHSMDERYMLAMTPQGDSVLMVAVAHAKYASACRRARFLLEAGANADCGRLLMEAGGTEGWVTSEKLVEEKVLNYKRSSSEDFTRERLAAIGRLLRQADAIHARSWLWPSKAGVETARAEKAGASDGFAIMLKNMKRRAVVNVASKVLLIHEDRVAVEQVIRTGDLPPGSDALAFRRP